MVMEMAVILAGLTFQSTGDEITVQVDPDFSIDCQGSGNIDPIDITASCATCTNPTVDYTLESDCLNAPQYFVDADVTDLGSATSLTITDDQGSAPQTVSSTGVVTFGPYANGTDVQLTAQNDQDANCFATSQAFSQENCTLNLVDCNAGPVNVNFCYESNQLEEFTFISSDGSSINLTVNSGDVEDGWDEFIVLDTDGSPLTPPDFYGNGGDLSGLTYQSTGDEITVQVDPDGSIDCQRSANIDPIDITAACATCTNPDVDYSLESDCLNAPQFFIDADVTDLGSATSLTVTDDQGSTPQTVNSTGVVTFGPYANGTDVQLTAQNDQDVNCSSTSQVFSQENCTLNLVDCDVGPVNVNFCYESNVLEEFTFVSSDGSSINLTVNSGDVEDGWDEFIVLDSDGTPLTPPDFYGNGGDLAGLTYQSTGDEITVQVDPDGSIDCQSSANIDPIDITAACATCNNPDVDYDVLGNCSDDDEEFSVDVTVNDLGSASAVEVSTNQGDGPITVDTTPGTITFGPYDLGTDVVVTTENVDDQNCIITSPSQTLESCGCFGADPFCAPDEGESLVFENVSSGITAPDGIDYDCLFTQPNPVWFYLQIDQGGDLDFEIVQNTSFDDQGNPNGTGLDVDFIAWGPFDTPDEACTDLNQNTQVACSYSIDAVENFTITNAQEDEIYVVLITNFAQDPGFISLGQTNVSSPSSGSTNCDIVTTTFVTACEVDGGATLNASNDNSQGYQWLEYDPETDSFNPISGADQSSYDVDESGIYQVQWLDNNLDITTEDFDVTIIPEPEIDDQTLALCNNQSSIDLEAEPANLSDYESIAYQWFNNGNPINGETQSSLNVTQPDDYSVEITTSNTDQDTDEIVNCPKTVSFIVTDASFSIDLGEDQTFCDADDQTITAQLTDADANDAEFSWSTGEVSQSIDVSETNIYTVTVTVDGCSVTQSVEYVFNESPDFDLGGDLETCDLAAIAIDATPANFDPSMTIFEWSKDGNNLESEIDAVVNPEDYGFGTYEVTAYSDAEDCFTTDQITIAQRNDISVTLNTDDTDNLFCAGEQVNISANLTNASVAEANFEWLVNGETQTGENADTFSHQTSEEDGVETIEVVVSINGDCEVSNSVVLDKYDIDNCTISQGLSPNNDGFNDELDLRFLDDRSGIRSLEIFDRYGSSVFKQSNYRDEFLGQNDDGDQLRTGTYFYVIKFEQEDSVYGLNHTGWIYIHQEQ